MSEPRIVLGNRLRRWRGNGWGRFGIRFIDDIYS
jgi:hypothetical protein